MSFIYLLLFVFTIIFLISSIFGLFRFISDTRKYSTYFDELKNLKEKAELLDFADEVNDD